MQKFILQPLFIIYFLSLFFFTGLKAEEHLFDFIPENFNIQKETLLQTIDSYKDEKKRSFKRLPMFHLKSIEKLKEIHAF